jgi:Fe-S-cluster containining protein
MSETADDGGSYLRQVDGVIAAFALATGLSCPPGCGACCANDKPRVSVNDVTPIAESLVARGLADEVLTRAATAPEGICVAYVGDAERGRCSEYSLRPSLCRLFGFAAVRDKHGGLALAACRVHKRTLPEAVARAQVAAADGHTAVFSDVQHAMGGMGRPELTALLPINRAIAIALERVLMRQAYAASEADQVSEPSPLFGAGANDTL